LTDAGLVEALATAAAEAVRKRRGAIEHGGLRNLRGLMIELEIANAGQVLDVTSHLSWKDVYRDATKVKG
jgi:hypothetical protein